MIRVHVNSVRSGTPGDVTAGGAVPVHPSSSRARISRRPALWMPKTRHDPNGGEMVDNYSTHPARRSSWRYLTGTAGVAGVAVVQPRIQKISEVMLFSGQLPLVLLGAPDRPALLGVANGTKFLCNGLVLLRG
jgi:hypothetical protein